MHGSLSKLFPWLSVSFFVEELSESCFNDFLRVHPYEEKNLTARVMDHDNVFIDHYPIIVPWFQGVREQLTKTDFVFQDK